jgi:hypothetical protein
MVVNLSDWDLIPTFRLDRGSLLEELIRFHDVFWQKLWVQKSLRLLPELGRHRGSV